MYFGCDHWSIRKIPICFIGFVCFVKNSFPFLVTGVSVTCNLLSAFEALWLQRPWIWSPVRVPGLHPGPFTSVYCLTSWICFFIREASSPVKWGTAVTLHSLEVWLLRGDEVLVWKHSVKGYLYLRCQISSGQLWSWQSGDDGMYAFICMVECGLLRWKRFPGSASRQIFGTSVLGSCPQCVAWSRYWLSISKMEICENLCSLWLMHFPSIASKYILFFFLLYHLYLFFLESALP